MFKAIRELLQLASRVELLEEESKKNRERIISLEKAYLSLAQKLYEQEVVLSYFGEEEGEDVFSDEDMELPELDEKKKKEYIN